MASLSTLSNSCLGLSSSIHLFIPYNLNIGLCPNSIKFQTYSSYIFFKNFVHGGIVVIKEDGLFINYLLVLWFHDLISSYKSIFFYFFFKFSYSSTNWEFKILNHKTRKRKKDGWMVCPSIYAQKFNFYFYFSNSLFSI